MLVRASFTLCVRKQNMRLPLHVLCVSMQLLVCQRVHQHVCMLRTPLCDWRTCVEGWTSPGQRYEWTRQISQRLKALLPSGGNGQALMLMWTNKRKPKWVEWAIICCGEALPWNWACLLCFQSGGGGGWGGDWGRWRERKRRVCVWEKDTLTHTQKDREREGVGGPESYWFHSCAKSKHCSVLYLLVCAASYKGHLYMQYPL